LYFPRIGYSQPLLDADIRVAKKLFEINVFGLVELTQKCASLLIKSKGTIIIKPLSPP
jgi:short-subunit dehydrogenase